MFSILRPFLFSLDPETAHDLAIKSLKYNPLPSKMFEVEDEQILNIELLGKQFSNPIGLAAGFDTYTTIDFRVRHTLTTAQ